MTNLLMAAQEAPGFDDLTTIVQLLADADEGVNLDGAKQIAGRFDLVLDLEYANGHWFAGFKSRKGDSFLSDQGAATLHGALWSAGHLALDEIVRRGGAALQG